MSIVPIDLEPSSDLQPSRILSVIPCDGTWWVVHWVERSGKQFGIRRKVVAWGLIERSIDGQVTSALEPLVADWNGIALPAADIWPAHAEYPNQLWHKGESICSCSLRPLSRREVDDIWWCERCVAEIVPDDWE